MADDAKGVYDDGRGMVVDASPPAAANDGDIQDAERLDELEEVVRGGIESFLAVGRALQAIRDGELYKIGGYGSIEDYCEERWGISRSTAYRRIDHAFVAGVLSPAGDTPVPITERQSRAIAPLARAAPDEAIDVWQTAVAEAGGVQSLRTDALGRLAAARLRTFRREHTTLDPPETEEVPDVAEAADPELDALLKTIKDNEELVLGWHRGEFQRHVNTLADGSVAFLFVDPPYGMARKTLSKKHPHGAIKHDENPEVAAEQLGDMLRLFAPKLADDAHVVVFCDPRKEARMRAEMEGFQRLPKTKRKKYLRMRSYAVWTKGGFGKGDWRNAFAPTHERLVHLTKGSPGFVKRPADVFEHRKVSTRAHTTRKPAALLREIIAALVPPDALVADPFGGSASTLVAALQEGRRAWGCEYEEGYYATGAERIVDALEDLGRSVPEVSTEEAKEVHPRYSRLVGAADEPRDSLASPLLAPEYRDRLSGLVPAWLKSLGVEKRSVVVEPFASDADAALLAFNHLLSERVLICSEEKNDAYFWSTLLDPSHKMGSFSGEPRSGAAYDLMDRIQGLDFSERLVDELLERSPADEAERVLRMLLANRSSAGGGWEGKGDGVWWWDAKRLVGLVKSLGDGAAKGRTTFRRVGGMRVLRDKELVQDERAAFFVDAPEGMSPGRLLGLLKRTKGQFLAVLDDERLVRSAARKQLLETRRLPVDGRDDAGLLVGRDLSWLDEGPPPEPEMPTLY